MSMRRRSGILVLAALAMLGVTACASGGVQAGRDTPSPKVVPAQKPVSLAVTNQNFADVDVYANVDGTPQRLAMVRSMNTVRVKLPFNTTVNGQVQLVVDPIGGFDNFTTEPITVNPGETIKLTVAQSLSLSNWTVD